MSTSATGTFFRSRWVGAPPRAAELIPDKLPTSFRAAGVACGIKQSGERDVGLLVCDADDAVSAARFTRNALVGAPVVVSRRASVSRLRGIVVNSGNANVSDGERGLRVAEAMVAAAADGLSVGRDRIGVASTGVIGQRLNRDRVLRGIDSALASLAPRAGEFAHSILTTDRGPKHATLELSLDAGSARLSAQAKGAGMMSPCLATLLCFIETDAAIDPPTLGRLLDAALERSFERISVDGQMSTSDSVFMIASGASRASVQPGSDDEDVFAAALAALLKQLAIEVVADGEGATRIARLEVHGGTGATEQVARAVANSPLVKCALFGADPNWGRILQAAGQALTGSSPVEFDLTIEGVQVAKHGVGMALADLTQRRLERAMQEPEVELRLSFGGGDEQAEIYFSDLGHDYVSLNSAYST